MNDPSWILRGAGGGLKQTVALAKRLTLAGDKAEARSTAQSQPESLAAKVIGVLETGGLSKSEVAARLGQKTVSGQLNKVIRQLLKENCIKYTIPEKPNSRLQKYRLTEKGKSGSEKLESRKGDAHEES